MKTELSASTAFAAVDLLGVVERYLEEMSQSTNDPAVLERLTLASKMVKGAANYVGFVGALARTQQARASRQTEELIRGLRARAEAKGCAEVGDGSR
jgi:hypothetical protein